MVKYTSLYLMYFFTPECSEARSDEVLCDGRITEGQAAGSRAFNINRPLGYERVYLPLYEVADTLFHFHMYPRGRLLTLKPILCACLFIGQ